VTNGAEAYSRCTDYTPDVILAAVDMPVMDGWTLVKTLAANPALRDVPVMLTSDDASDMVRLHAYRLGVRDFVHKPFTDEEVVIRLRRLAVTASQPKGSMLRGALGDISIATLLSLLEFERKSGILVVLRDVEAARLFLAQGRVVKVEGPGGDRSPFERMMTILGWQEGNFEFTGCEVVGTDELDRSTTQLLLEHARLDDEGER
jgi:CheY-like chemotaxis protein